MELGASSFLAGMLVSGVGFVLLVYGKRMGRVPQLVTGLVMLVYPYFVPGALLILAVAVPLLALLWLAVRAGY